MAKVNPNKLIQKRRTEAEMRKALSFLAGQRAERSTPPDIDDPDIVLQDCIEELLESRQMLEEMRGFVSQWHAKFTRK